jgi:hypothetical protein
MAHVPVEMVCILASAVPATAENGYDIWRMLDRMVRLGVGNRRKRGAHTSRRISGGSFAEYTNWARELDSILEF